MCTPGGGCDPGLVCAADQCVDPGAETDSGTAATVGTGGGGATSGPGTTGTTGIPGGCGDGQVDPTEGEQCDDGNIADGDGCDSSCQVEVGSPCGDGTLDPTNGEECDDGNTAPGDGCSANCQLEPLGASCGDSTVDPLEVCDDGNVSNGDGCNPTCNLTNTTEVFVGAAGQSGLVDGQGTAARLGGWCVVAADNTYLWVGDSTNMAHAVVRRVDISTADVVTVAGDPGGSNGDQDDPIGTNARLGWVEAITTDGATIWVADEANHKIKAVDVTPPHAVTTVAGSGANQVADGNGLNADFAGVRGITYYNGIVYVLDGGTAVLRSFDPSTGDVVTIAGAAGQTGQVDDYGTAARFISPRYMASDNSGMLYIADTNGNKIRSYNTVDTFVGSFAGDGTAGYVDGVGAAARIHRPRGMASDGTSVYFSEFNQHTIRQGVIATQEVTTNIGQHCSGAMNCVGGYQEGQGTAGTQLTSPVGLAFHHPSNTMFVCDSGNNVIRALR